MSQQNQQNPNQQNMDLPDTRQNLLLVSPMLHQGGFERVCVRTARLLAPYYHITIAIFDSADIAYDVSGLEIVDLKLGVRQGRLGKAVNVLRRIRALKKLKKEKQIQVTYSFGPTANLVNIYAKAVDRIVCGIRSYMDFDNPRTLSLTCRRADEVACCSEEIEQRLRSQFGAENCFTLYNPIRISPAGEEKEVVYTDEIRQFYDTHSCVIMSMGREDDVKGFWHLLKAFASLKKDKTLPEDAALIIPGDGTFEEYKVLAEQLGIGESCLFPGVVKEPFGLLKKAQVFVLTSLREGFPNVLVEAMACGLPVIAADCPSGPREILLPEEEREEVLSRSDWDQRPEGIRITPYGILTAPLEEEKNLDPLKMQAGDLRLASALSQLLGDAALIKKLRTGSAARAEDFSDERYIEVCRAHLKV